MLANTTKISSSMENRIKTRTSLWVVVCLPKILTAIEFKFFFWIFLKVQVKIRHVGWKAGGGTGQMGQNNQDLVMLTRTSHQNWPSA